MNNVTTPGPSLFLLNGIHDTFDDYGFFGYLRGNSGASNVTLTPIFHPSIIGGVNYVHPAGDYGVYKWYSADKSMRFMTGFIYKNVFCIGFWGNTAYNYRMMCSGNLGGDANQKYSASNNGGIYDIISYDASNSDESVHNIFLYTSGTGTAYNPYYTTSGTDNVLMGSAYVSTNGILLLIILTEYGSAASGANSALNYAMSYRSSLLNLLSSSPENYTYEMGLSLMTHEEQDAYYQKLTGKGYSQQQITKMFQLYAANRVIFTNSGRKDLL